MLDGSLDYARCLGSKFAESQPEEDCEEREVLSSGPEPFCAVAPQLRGFGVDRETLEGEGRSLGAGVETTRTIEGGVVPTRKRLRARGWHGYPVCMFALSANHESRQEF